MRATSAAAFREFDRVQARVAFGVRFTVTVELSDGRWAEYHANDPDNARAIADNSVKLLMARGATCWDVKRDGTMARSPFYSVFDYGPDAD